jgi:adenylosuccinate lyase
MPHKRNPHASERISGLARLLRGYAATAAENNALWHERDISHSSTERIILPDAFIALDFMLHESADILERLVVYPERMRANIDATNGLIFSQGVLLALLDAGMDRQDAYRLVQGHAHGAAGGGPSLQEALASDPRVTSLVPRERMEAIFDAATQLGNIGAVFARLGLNGADVHSQ